MLRQLYDEESKWQDDSNVFYECIKYKLLLLINNIFIC